MIPLHLRLAEALKTTPDQVSLMWDRARAKVLERFGKRGTFGFARTFSAFLRETGLPLAALNAVQGTPPGVPAHPKGADR